MSDYDWLSKTTPVSADILLIQDSEASSQHKLVTFANARKAILPGATTTTDNAVARFNGTAGDLQNSGVIIDDSNNITGVVSITASGGIVLSGTSANLTLGSNYISYGGTDAGFSLDSSNNATLSANFTVSGAQSTHTMSNSGGGVFDAVANSSDTAGSDAYFHATAGGASGGDAFVKATISGVIDNAWGIDNSDSDAWKLTTGATPSTGTTLLKIAQDGVITIPNLAGSGTRTVVVDANGVMSAP